MYEITEQIGEINVYRYDYDYVDYDTKENKRGFTTFINFDEVPKKWKEVFGKWMHGQTTPIIPKVDHTIYSWDWERFYNMKTRGTPTYFD